MIWRKKATIFWRRSPRWMDELTEMGGGGVAAVLIHSLKSVDVMRRTGMAAYC